MSGLGMREAARVIAIDAIERVVLVRYFLVRTPVFEPVPGHTWEQLNAERVSAVRWWTIDEILGTPEALFAPRRLGALLRELLDRGSPSRPIDVGV